VEEVVECCLQQLQKRISVIPGLTRNPVPANALNSLDSGSGPE